MAEILDIVDEQGRPTGQTVPRAVAHAEGIRHRTSHVWILRRHAGRVEVLLQMRCQAKDSFPGCYDISSAHSRRVRFCGVGTAGTAGGAWRDPARRCFAGVRRAALYL